MKKNLPSILMMVFGWIMAIGGFVLTIQNHWFVGFWCIIFGFLVVMFGVFEFQLNQ